MDKIIYFLIFLLFSKALFAQESWSLDDCVAYAVAHNLSLKNLKYSEASDKETYRQSVRDLLPNLSGSSDYNIQYGRSTDPNTNDIVNSNFFSNNYSLNSSIGIFQGFQKINTIKATKFLYRAARNDALQEKYLLAFRVMTAYYDIKFYEGLLTISQEQSKIAQTNYNLVKKQVALGIKAGADLYEAEATLLGDQLLVTQNGNKLAAAKLTLLQEMNLQGTTDILLQDEFEKRPLKDRAIDIDSVYTEAKSFVPMLKAQELRTQAAKKELASSRGSLYPSISLYGAYGTGYYETNVDTNGKLIPFSTQIKDNASRYVGVSITIPISNRWSARSRVKQQKINLLRAKNNRDIQEQELYQLIQQLVQDHRALQLETEQSTKKMESQKLAFTIAQKKYEKGLINALELFQAKTLYGNSQNENLQVGLKLKVNEKTLDFYKGLPIFNIGP